MFSSVLSKELKNFFSSTIFYGVVSFFFVLQGAFLFVLPDYNILDSGYAELKNFFESCPYVFCVILPALCMGLFSEERRFGTIVELVCSQISVFRIIFTKFIAASIVGTLLIFCSLVYFAVLWQFASPSGNIDTPSILCSYLGLELLMLTMCSISVVGASISKNQIISFLFSATLCLFAYFGLESLKVLFSWTSMANVFMQTSLRYHFVSMSRGVIDSRDLVYFLATISFSLLSSIFLIEKVINKGKI